MKYSKIFGSKDEKNPLLLYNNESNQDEINDENDKNGHFVNINMIPKTIDDLIRKEMKN